MLIILLHHGLDFEMLCLIHLREIHRLAIDLDGVRGPEDSAGNGPRDDGVRHAVMLQSAGERDAPRQHARPPRHLFAINP